MKKKRLNLDKLNIKSFVTDGEIAKEATIKGGKPVKLTEQGCTHIPCSAIDACPSAWACPTYIKPCDVSQPIICFTVPKICPTVTQP